MSKPRVSIAMTTYNGERFVAEQLESFVHQERLPDELVVSDDGSTDATLDILRTFAGEAPFPVRLLVNEKRLGINGNFGRAVAASTGDIIFFSDSDDYWYPQKIRMMEKALEEAPEAGLAVCDSDLVDEHLRPLGSRAWAAIGKFFPSQRLLRDLARGTAYITNMPSGGSCTAFRAKFKELVLPFPGTSETRPCSYDHFTARVIYYSGAGGAVLLPVPLLAYRRHQGQTMRPPEPFVRRSLRHFAARRESPYLLPILLQRIESDCAARHCINNAIRQSAMRHWRARLNMPRSFTSRVPVVARELISFRYHRFSGDALSASKDLFFARAKEDAPQFAGFAP